MFTSFERKQVPLLAFQHVGHAVVELLEVGIATDRLIEQIRLWVLLTKAPEQRLTEHLITTNSFLKLRALDQPVALDNVQQILDELCVIGFLQWFVLSTLPERSTLNDLPKAGTKP
ncbi:Uncharacterised protein [Streptococcus pneumoniae]|nr:Uncharacterised protein [Streptococcus pneumoniae]